MSHPLDQWLVGQLPHLIQLAALPFEQVRHEAFCERVGWEAVRDDCYPESCFGVHFEEVERRLIAVYDEPEAEIGMGLYVLGDEAGDGVFTTTAEYDEAFRTTLALIEPKFPAAAIRGTYRHDTYQRTHLFHYAYWIVADTFVMLVQHREGAAHSGSECSLDIRIRPRRGAAVLKFPLTTNMLF